MALSTAQSGGSGEFVPEREWSCPCHEQPQTHECDCDGCPIDYWLCSSCAEASWVDRIGPDGAPVMRELSVWEAALRHQTRNPFMPPLLVEAILNTDPATIEWVEDDLHPRILPEGEVR